MNFVVYLSFLSNWILTIFLRSFCIFLSGSFPYFSLFSLHLSFFSCLFFTFLYFFLFSCVFLLHISLPSFFFIFSCFLFYFPLCPVLFSIVLFFCLPVWSLCISSCVIPSNVRVLAVRWSSCREQRIDLDGKESECGTSNEAPGRSYYAHYYWFTLIIHKFQVPRYVVTVKREGAKISIFSGATAHWVAVHVMARRCCESLWRMWRLIWGTDT